jgi:succinate-acetate transporter protein
VVTFILLIQTFKINMAIALLFANLTFFFVLLSAAEQTSSDSFLMKFTGGWGIWTALSAVYAAAGELTNTTYEKEVVPMGNFGEVDYGIASPGKGESVVKKTEAPTGNIA